MGGMRDPRMSPMSCANSRCRGRGKCERTIYAVGTPGTDFNQIYIINTTTGKGTNTHVEITGTGSTLELDTRTALAYQAPAAVPEPAAAALMAAGLALLWGVRGRANTTGARPRISARGLRSPAERRPPRVLP